MKGMADIAAKIPDVPSEPLRADGIKLLQLNLGYKCNAACKHCHIEAGPNKTQMMSRDVMDAALDVSQGFGIETLDLTGGAPELNPFFRYLVKEAKKIGRHVIVRTNLTIFFEEGMADLPGFYADHDVEVIASLPCYTEAGCDIVRGAGAFAKSIEALKKLNALGFGSSDKKRLHLVYNPCGPFLPPCQSELERQYKRELFSSHGILFNRLFVFANMPIGRFKESLVDSGGLESYMGMLKRAFNPSTLDKLMCRSQISIGGDGRLYDCDFNQALGLTIDEDCSPHIGEFDHSRLSVRRIAMENHCLVCAAGSGFT